MCTWFFKTVHSSSFVRNEEYSTTLGFPADSSGTSRLAASSPARSSIPPQPHVCCMEQERSHLWSSWDFATIYKTIRFTVRWQSSAFKAWPRQKCFSHKNLDVESKQAEATEALGNNINLRRLQHCLFQPVLHRVSFQFMAECSGKGDRVS